MSTNISKKDVIYSDFLTDFDVHPVKQDLVRVVNEASVKRAIRNLLFINKTERFFRPDVGSSIRQYLFEPMTPFTAISLKNEIDQTLRNYESRINLLSVQVIPAYEQNSYLVRLVFYIINKPDPITYNVSLERIR